MASTPWPSTSCAGDFPVTAWDSRAGVKQVWFVGAHADVGGGYSAQESRLSDIALEWMMKQLAEVGVLFVTPPLRVLDLTRVRTGLPRALDEAAVQSRRARADTEGRRRVPPERDGALGYERVLQEALAGRLLELRDQEHGKQCARAADTEQKRGVRDLQPSILLLERLSHEVQLPDQVVV